MKRQRAAAAYGQDLMRGEWTQAGKSYDPKTCPTPSGTSTGTSIFDPVLCELVYRWFSPPRGLVLDPFAGGSVRGIVAAMLGRRYVGVDLSETQCEANRAQWDAIGAGAGSAPGEEATAQVRVSGKMLRQEFHPCSPEYITSTCKGRCCQGSNGILVTVHPSEVDRIEALGAEVRDGLLVADSRGLCPFKTDEGFCSIHGEEKPFGCKASPFTLNKNSLLIVRNRYRLLRCAKGAGRVPAYEAHRWSLEQVFGVEEAARVADACAAGEDEILATMPTEQYRMLVDNDRIKRGAAPEADQYPEPRWLPGDSRNLDAVFTNDDPVDLVFSCPPYADLEVYSDDPLDLSTMAYPDFRDAYRDIIRQSVARLAGDRFAVFVVGEARDKRGNYYDFIGDTVQAFRDAGLEYYNEAILVTALASLPIRAPRAFEATRKLGKTHQNVLVFVKGDPKAAAAEFGLPECGDFSPEDAVDG